MHCPRPIALLALFALSGCPTEDSKSMPPAGDGAVGAAAGAAGHLSGPGGSAGGGGATGTDGGTPAEVPKLPYPDAAAPTPGKPLAEACASNSECASGFCVDGVCCNSACDSQCFNCAEAGTVGYCTAQIVGDDLHAAQPCTGASTCGFDLTFLNASLTACRLKNQQACRASSDCAGLNCATFYADADGDGYGNAARALHLCEQTGVAAPGGYVTQAGDCCDSDPNAFSGQTSYFKTADGCGSFDYSCDGTIEGSNGLLPQGTVPASACGQAVRGPCTSCTETIVCH